MPAQINKWLPIYIHDRATLAAARGGVDSIAPSAKFGWDACCWFVTHQDSAALARAWEGDGVC